MLIAFQILNLVLVRTNEVDIDYSKTLLNVLLLGFKGTYFVEGSVGGDNDGGKALSFWRSASS
jgi:hypothetical protein